jgi:hypothetical protein
MANRKHEVGRVMQGVVGYQLVFRVCRSKLFARCSLLLLVQWAAGKGQAFTAFFWHMVSSRFSESSPPLQAAQQQHLPTSSRRY